MKSDLKQMLVQDPESITGAALLDLEQLNSYLDKKVQEIILNSCQEKFSARELILITSMLTQFALKMKQAEVIKDVSELNTIFHGIFELLSKYNENKANKMKVEDI